MSEEEAIERLKERVKLDRKIRDNKTESDYEQFCENECQAIETILNLADKQQKEIAELMKICDLYKNASEHCAENFLKAIKPNYIGKDKIREIISNKRKKVLEKHNSKLSISKRIYKRNVQVAMLDTLLKELLEENNNE